MTWPRELKAADIMSTRVVSVDPQTPVHEIAELLTERRISGVPVLADGRLVGVVDETDLLRRHELGTERTAAVRSWLERLFRIDPSPHEYVKAHGLTAKDVMADAPVTIPEDEPLSSIATRFDVRDVRRLFVVRNDRVVGVITRADFVRALAASAKVRRELPHPSDDEIRAALLAELSKQPWWHPEWSTVTVTDGVVQFHGAIETQDERDAARVAAENIPGVRRVEDHRLRYFDPIAAM